MQLKVLHHRVTLLTPEDVLSFASLEPVARFCATTPESNRESRRLFS